MIKIQVYHSDNLISEFEGDDSKEISIGRAQGCSIHLDEPSISRLHAVIFPMDGGWVVQRKANFGSLVLNGQEIENAPLEGGEELQIGSFSLRVQVEAPEPTSLMGPKSGATGSISEKTASLAESEDGRTRFVSSGVNALFRMELGAANVDEFLLEKDLAVFGRGSNCDVVLTEKKASRKHFEVRRQGLSFFLKDLNSANGTLVNGSPVTETELVSGDLIQVGESKIHFSVENKEFFARQDQFMPVPAHLSQAAPLDMGGLGEVPAEGALGPDGLPAGGGGQDLGPDGTPLPPRPNSNTDFLGWARYKWAQIPKAQRLRYLAILVVGCLVMVMLGAPDDEKPVKPPKPKGVNASRRFEDLTPKNQAFVRENYKHLLAAHEKKDYQGMLEKARNILSLVDEFNDTKSYEAIAKRGLDQIEEEKKRRELEEKQRKVREEVAKLEEKAQAVFERALNDPSARPELDAVIQEIYVKDPNNRKAAEWKQKIKDKIDEEKRAEQLAREKEELRRKAEDAYAAVEKLLQEGKYMEAIKEAAKLGDVGWTEKEYLDKVEKLKNDIQDKLKSVLDPLLLEARNQRGETGDLAKARDRYLDVLRISPLHEEARRGLNEIRQVLQLRAKRYYNEAILAERVYSDLQEAKEKYEKCLHNAPDEDGPPPVPDYRARCKRMLMRFEAFTPDAGGRN